MTDLTSFFKVDLVDDHVAGDVNKLIAAVLRAEYANTETLLANKTLTDNDCQFQFLTASGADRNVLLAPESTSNHVMVIQNAGTSNSIIVKDDSATTILGTLSRGEWAMFLPFGGIVWKKAAGSGETSTVMDGLKLIWNSATSISVDIGACYAENGDLIDVPSVIVKSGLSLSASTFYHVYVFLSSGVAAAEVVTTAPVAWKGTAYSKTGDVSRRYVGSVLTDGSGNVKKFYHDPFMNTVFYMKFNAGGSPHRVLSLGTATTATAVSCSGAVPVTSKLAYVRIANSADQLARTSDDNGVSSTQVTISLNIGNTAAQVAVTYHPLDASQQLFYQMGAAVGTGGLVIDVLGYAFER